MKKILGLMAVIAMSAGAASAQTELIQNGNLDAWTGGVPDDWSLIQIDAAGNAGGAAVIAESTTEVNTPGPDASSMHIQTGGGFTFRYVAHTNSWGAITNAVDNEFTFNGAVRGLATDSRTRVYIAVSADGTGPWVVNFVKTGNGVGTGFGDQGLGNVPNPGDAWVPLTAVLNAPTTFDGGTSGTDLYRLTIHAIDNNTYVDDISLTYVEAASVSEWQSY